MAKKKNVEETETPVEEEVTETEVLVDEDKYPSNSFKSRIIQNGVEAEENRKIISGTVTVKQSATKQLGNNIKNTFFDVATNVLMPTLRNAIYDILNRTISSIIFNRFDDPSPRRATPRVRRGGYVPYSNSYDYYDDGYDYDPFSRKYDRMPDQQLRYARVLKDLYYQTKEDADMMLYDMKACCNKYGNVSVAYYYEKSGERQDYTDHDYGWSDLSMVQVKMSRDGWYLTLPDPKPIK